MNMLMNCRSKIKMNPKWMLYVFFVIFFGNSCQSPERKREISYYINTCTHVDSIINFYFQENDPVKYVQNICNTETRLERVGLNDSAQKLIGKMEAFAYSAQNNRFFNYHYLNRAYHYLNIGSLDSAWHFYQKREKFSGLADDNNKLMSYNFAGCYYYQIGEVDSARREFVKGYKFSKEINDTLQLYGLALNAGATFHDLGMFQSALYYFSEAYAIGLRRKNVSLLLVNNLVASLTTEGKFQKALDLCEKNRDRWMSDPKDPGAILLKLNYCHVLTMLNQFEKCNEILDIVNPSEISEVHLPFYYSIVLNYKLNAKSKDEAKKYIDSLSGFIYKNQPESVTEMDYELDLASSKGVFSLNLDSFVLKYKSEGSKDWNQAYLSKYAALIASVYQDRGDLKESFVWGSFKNKHLASMVKYNDSLNFADIDQQVDHAILRNTMDRKQVSIEKNESRNQFLTTLLIFFILIVAALIVVFFLFITNRKKKLDIVKLENKLVSQELQMLRQDKELKDNVVNISQTVLQQVSQLSLRLRNANFAKDPEAIAIRQDIDRLNQLSESLSEPNLSASVYESYEYVFDRYPNLIELNSTERKILVLTILGNKPKEIGTLLNLNDQYIRNVKSKIKKLLPIEYQTDWSLLK